MHLYQIEVCPAQDLVITGTNESEETVSSSASSETESQSTYSETSDKEILSPLDWGEGGLFEKYSADKEISDRRDQFAKHFRNADGTVTAVMTSGMPINYLDNGVWKTIRTEIQPNVTGKYSGHPYVNFYNSDKHFYPAQSGADGVLLELGNGDVLVDWIHPSMSWFNADGAIGISRSGDKSTAVVSSNTVLYPSVFPGIDVIFTQGNLGKKLDIIIDNRNAISGAPSIATGLGFSETVILPSGWSMVTEPDKNNSKLKSAVKKVIFLNDQGKEVMYYEPPEVLEQNEEKLIAAPLDESITPKLLIQNGTESENEEPKINEDRGVFRSHVSFQVEQIGNKITIWTVTSVDWLFDAQRQYPVIVDPTSVLYSSGTNYTGYHDGWDGSTNRGDYFPGYYGGWLNAYAEVNITSIPDGSDVTAVTFNQYEYNAWRNTTWGLTMYLRDMAARGSTQSGTALRDDIIGGTTFISETSIPFAIAWRSYVLNASGVADLEGRLTSNWFAVGVQPWSSFNYNYAGMRGWSNANRPYFDITYIDPCTTPGGTTASGAGTICTGGSKTVTASGGAGGTIYWQNTTSNGTSTATPSTSQSVSPVSTTTYYFRSYNSAGGGCWGTQGSVIVTVVADPTTPTATKSPNVATVCAGQTLTLTGPSSSGGTGTCNYQYQYSTNGGSTYSAWSNTVASFAAVTGTNLIRIRRNCSGAGCNISGFNTYSWTVVADPSTPTATKSPTDATVCAGQTLTLTGPSSSGGTGTCNYQYQYSTNGGSTYSAWSNTVASFAAVTGTNLIRIRRNCNGNGCNISGYNQYSWT
ncbi:MAG: hypothetical protein JKX73_03000, partial [Flavobacteriales bacterium]|nr:hypothetical protein [Flavobacteriales bacterium]